eukprot:scaffold130582_cov30-Tisochrysis_lutea.AAC.1
MAHDGKEPPLPHPFCLLAALSPPAVGASRAAFPPLSRSPHPSSLSSSSSVLSQSPSLPLLSLSLAF